MDENERKRKPKEGYKFIYRYFDDGGSYIGQTKESLSNRAGKNGKSYCTVDSKWARAILEKGFDHFNVEILCECLESEADKKEKEFIKQFDSRRKGYNTSPGGVWYPGDDCVSNNREFQIVNIRQIVSDMKEQDVIYLCKIISKLFEVKFENYSKESLLSALKACNEINKSVPYYAFEGEWRWISCSALDYLYDYLEIIPNTYNYLKNLYVKDCLRSQGIYDCHVISKETINIKENYEKRYNEILNNITESDIDAYCDIIDFENSIWIDVASGDCISLGISLIYKF